MTCHHIPGDPSRSTNVEVATRIAGEMAEDAIRRAEERVRELTARTPTTTKCWRSSRLATFSSCEGCSFDSQKIVVLRASLRDAVFWTRADPHFDDESRSRHEMPSPVARFPVTDDGWSDAIDFASMKSGVRRV